VTGSWEWAENRTVGGFETTWRMRMMRPSGFADERFGAVADALARNFDEFPELGAAVAVYVGGRKVVDLCGGIADEATGRAWT
jgi:CubicO group peptidase (beta-lactamase class C family)